MTRTSHAPRRSIGWRRLRLSTTFVALAAGACSLTAPPAEDVLRTGEVDDQRCEAAVAAFRARPDDPEVALQTARVLFEAADLTVQQALVAEAEQVAGASVADVLAVEDELPDAVRERVLGLASTGAEAAQVAVDAPLQGDALVEANVLLAQHLSFVAWANGPMRSLMAGYGGRIQAAMARALELDATWDHGAPLRLKGRFLCEAPWPLRDRDASLELLRRAVEQRALPIHHLFLGDVLSERGDAAGAIEQWRMVANAEADETTRRVAPFHRRMAALRLQAAQGSGS